MIYLNSGLKSFFAYTDDASDNNSDNYNNREENAKSSINADNTHNKQNGHCHSNARNNHIKGRCARKRSLTGRGLKEGILFR